MSYGTCPDCGHQYTRTGACDCDLFPPNCSWCGHAPHRDECPGRILQGKGKNARYVDCPCARRGDI